MSRRAVRLLAYPSKTRTCSTMSETPRPFAWNGPEEAEVCLK